VLDDEELLVLHPALGKGFRVWVSGIATGRQLHTLLADALIGDPAQGLLPGTRPDPRVVALARGQPARTVDTSGLSAHPDVCLLNLLSWHHLRPDGALKPGTVTLLWPSSTLAEIVPFEGLRVVLLGPPAMQLAWSTAREFRHMAAEVRLLEILDAATVRAWLARMATAPR
jgi:hypothetical protein